MRSTTYGCSPLLAGGIAVHLVGLCLLAALAPSDARADDWRTGVGGNSARNGRSNEIGPSAPDILWQGSRPALVSQQGVCEGNLLVLSRISSWAIPDGTWIVAHDLTTGDQLWAARLPNDFPGDSWRSRVSAIDGGIVYATRAGNTNLDYLYALDVADGSIIWRSQELIDEGSTESLAFTSDGDIIAGNHFGLMRISRADGSTVWETPRTCPTTNGCQAAVFGERIYIWEAGGDGPMIAVHDAATGQWLYAGDPIGGGYVQQTGPFVAPDGTVYAPRTQNSTATDYLVAYWDSGAGLIETWRAALGYVPFASFGIGPDLSVYTYSTVDLGTTVELTVRRLSPIHGGTLSVSQPILTNYPAAGIRIAVDAAGTIFMTNGGFSHGGLFSFDRDLTLRWSESITNVNVGGPVLGQDGILVVCGVGTDVRAYQTAGPTLPGDMNCDGLVDSLDIAAFVVAVLDPTQYEQTYPTCSLATGDLNGDGTVDLQDTEAFIQCLLSGGCP